jgi:hypothetical protein
LQNIKGEIIYKGKEIEQQNFSNLPKGVYFLRINKEIIKLIKE